MKKLLIISMIFLSTFALFIKVTSGYKIVDNTADGVHNALSTPLINIVTSYLNGSITGEQAIQQGQNLIQSVSNGSANLTANFDSNGVLHVGCTNNGSLIMVIPDNGSSSSANGSNSQPPEPPVPVYTTSTSNESCSYVSSWSPNWSNCSINSNWDSNGKITCSQINTWSANYNTASWSCSTTLIDGVPQGDTSCNGSCPSNTTKPADVFDTKTITMYLGTPTTINSNAYANNSDSNNITVNISGSTNQNKAIVGLPTGITDIQDTSGLKTNRIYNTGDNALNFDGVTTNGIMGTGNNFYFDINGIKSYAPLKTNNSSISFKANGVEMILSGIKYQFEKPFTGEIKVWDNIGENWNGKIDIGTSNKFMLVSNENKTIPEINFSITNFLNNLFPINNNLEIVNKTLSGETLSEKEGVIFYTTLNTSETASGLTSPGLIINEPPIINYNLNGKNVSYYLNNSEEGDNNEALVNNNGKDFIGVNVIGILQGGGKQTITGQENNFSSISKLESRTQIRKNSYSYINNMNSGETLNGVYYYNGDKKISEINLTNIETIIIKDGNLIIDKNIDNNIGIIVLKDGYNIDNGYMTSGNIYVKPNVTYIKAIIYADGGFISVKSDGSIYTEDNFERTNDLKNQLIMHGSLFTKNTIGGAILAGGEYILPGDIKIANSSENFFKAMTYDLNYIRRSNIGCDKSLPLNETCDDIGEYSEAFIIKYNSSIQTNPPILFKIEN